MDAIAIRKRTLFIGMVLLAVALAMIAGEVRAGHTDPPVPLVYTVEQEGLFRFHRPIVGPDNVVDFYDYNSAAVIPFFASANTGLEESGISQLFLYENAGDVSLVIIHDKPDDGSGGHVIFDFSGIPGGAAFVVRDDPGEDPYFIDGTGSSTVDWGWAPCCTDGGAISGGGMNGEFSITIDPSFLAGIDTWQYLRGRGLGVEPGIVTLDPEKPVTITAGRIDPIKMTGGGQVDTGEKNHSHSFGFNMGPVEAGYHVTLEYNDNHFGKASGKKGEPSPLQIQINGLANFANGFRIDGEVIAVALNAPCTVRQLGPDNEVTENVCRVLVRDNGEPGVGNDRFSLRVVSGPQAGYTSSILPLGEGTFLTKGNIQAHNN